MYAAISNMMTSFVHSILNYFDRGHPVVLIIELNQYVYYYFQSEHNNIIGVYNIYLVIVNYRRLVSAFL